MDQESPIQLGQRGQDARQEVPLRTLKSLYAQACVLYQPEFLICPHYGEAFLSPLKHVEWPILDVLSDEQTGLEPVVAAVLPNIRHQVCQFHSLRHLAAPLAEADNTKLSASALE